MFGKPGRPPEDRLQRRREIWAAVSPLIEDHGARNLTMRQAAAASYMSLGGLYHYFPDKRSLVLFGLDKDAHQRVCLEFKAQHGHLKDSDPQAAADAFVHFFASTVSFVRPALRAALEMGSEEFLTQLEVNINMGLQGFVETLRLALPDTDEGELRAVARIVRRVVLAGLLDRSSTKADIEEELGAVVRRVTGARGETTYVAAG